MGVSFDTEPATDGAPTARCLILVTPDGERLLYLARFEEGYDLWSYQHRKEEIKLLAKLKGLRGTALDVFGKTEERRTERALRERERERYD